MMLESSKKELLVISFGTSFKDSRQRDIKGIEDALQRNWPDWQVRRAFTSGIVIRHIEKDEGVKIDTVREAMERAVKDKVRELIIQPTHLMCGIEYDKLVKIAGEFKDRFERLRIASPLLGEEESGSVQAEADKKVVAIAVVDRAMKEAGYVDASEASKDGTALVLMGHGTEHQASVVYTRMQEQMEKLGYHNVFVGTVEGLPKDTSCESILHKVKGSGYQKVILRPLMVVAGDHAHNDMAGEEKDSWRLIFEDSGAFQKVSVQLSGLGSMEAIQKIYIDHTAAVMNDEKK